MNIYIVNFEFPPIGGPGIWRALAIAKYASQAGHQVTVLCSDRSCWHNRTDENLLKSVPENVTIHRTYSTFPNDITSVMKERASRSERQFVHGLMRWLAWHTKNLWPDTIVHWTIKSALLARRLAKDNPPDCVITTGPQHFSHLVGYALNTKRKTPWIMDYRDPWTDFENPEQISSGPYQLQLNRYLEKRLLNQASAVTVVSPSWLDLLQKKAKDPSKFHLIYNGHDLHEDEVTSLSSIASQKANKLKKTESQIHIHFNGTIQSGSNLIPSLLNALDLIRASEVPVSYFLFTFCGLTEGLTRLIAEHNYSDTCLDLGPTDHATALMRCLDADVLLVLVKDGEKARRGTIPAKVFEAMALGQHILAILPPLNDTRTVLEGYGDNVTLSASTSVIDIQNTLIGLASTFQRTQFRHPISDDVKRERIINRFHRKSQVSQFLSLAADLQKEES